MSRRHQLIRYRLLAAFSSVTLGEDSLLDDLDAGDDLALVINSLDSNDDDLHGRLLSLPRGDCRPPPSGGQATHDFSYITRDEVSTAKEKHNNISLHQLRSHLVLTSACQ